MGTDPDLHLENLPSPSDVSTPSVNQSAPPIPLITVTVPGGHGIQAGLITVRLMTSGNTGEMLGSKFAAQEAAGSHLVNSTGASLSLFPLKAKLSWGAERIGTIITTILLCLLKSSHHLWKAKALQAHLKFFSRDSQVTRGAS